MTLLLFVTTHHFNINYSVLVLDLKPGLVANNQRRVQLFVENKELFLNEVEKVFNLSF